MRSVLGITVNESALQGHRKTDFFIERTLLLKIVAFKRTIGNFLNPLAVYIACIRHPPICCLFDTLFSCQWPFN
jgi:hypothetical protein